MGFLKWGPQFELGIREMDDQHKKWLELLNRFYDNIGSDNLHDQVLLLIDDALRYTRFHFDEEENYMKSIGFPGLEEQKRMHIDITASLESYKKTLETKRFLVSTDVTRELKNWFREHILIEDMKYAAFSAKAKSPVSSQ